MNEKKIYAWNESKPIEELKAALKLVSTLDIDNLSDDELRHETYIQGIAWNYDKNMYERCKEKILTSYLMPGCGHWEYLKAELTENMDNDYHIRIYTAMDESESSWGGISDDPTMIEELAHQLLEMAAVLRKLKDT